MRVLLDESLPRKLALEISGHEVQTVQKQGWAGLKNGELLRRSSPGFDVLVTGESEPRVPAEPDQCVDRRRGAHREE